MRTLVTVVIVALASLVAGTAAAADLSVWAAPEGFKIDKFGKKIFTLDPAQKIEEIKKENSIWNGSTRTISVVGARGETVAFQLGIEGGVTNVNVKPLALKGPGGELPAGTIQLFKIYYTPMMDKGSGPTNGPSMGQGWYPDALVPWSVGDTDAYGGYDGPPFAVKDGEIQGVWVDLSIPYGTQSGEYVGGLTVSAEGAEAAIKLVVKVRDFDIPRKIHNTFFMNFDLSDLNQAGGYWLKGDQLVKYEDEVYRDSRRHRFTAGNMYNNTLPRVDETPDGNIRGVDWSKYDADFDKVLNPKRNLFGPGEDAIEIWKVPLGAGIRSLKCPKSDKAWEPMIAEIKKHWQEKGWDLSRAYAYLADEPGKRDADKLNEYARRIKDSPGPALRRQIAVYTILGHEWDGQKGVFDLWKDNLDMWMVAGDYYHVHSMNALPKNCLKGMYQGAEPFQGNETLDADGMALRTWSWVAWQYRIDYLCYYSMAEAWRGVKRGQNKENCEIWDQPRNRSWGISQGVYIYPGNKVNYNLPIWNIRTRQIRRGQTDFEYFWLLRQAGQEALADSLCKGVLHVALSEAAPRPEAYSAGKWSHNPEDWDAAIRKAGDKLEELKAGLPKEPETLAK
jgi:hypothetical protein